jgi:hypothetical protein
LGALVLGGPSGILAGLHGVGRLEPGADLRLEAAEGRVVRREGPVEPRLQPVEAGLALLGLRLGLAQPVGVRSRRHG